jgi:protein-L-isoaspartate(D-aspartate) O-methyltransferase
MDDSLKRREAMLQGQILPNRVTDERVAAAILAVPREPFLPRELRGVAYIDEDIPIGGGRYLMEPVVFARLLQAARLGRDDVVLDVGCGTGYSSAVLSHLASVVVGLECDAELIRRANANLAGLGIDNVAIVTGPLAEGCPRQAPFNVIMLNGAVEVLPEALTRQLAAGGRLLAVERRRGVGKAMRHVNLGGIIGATELFDAQVPALPGFGKPPCFVF